MALLPPSPSRVLSALLAAAGALVLYVNRVDPDESRVLGAVLLGMGAVLFALRETPGRARALEIAAVFRHDPPERARPRARRRGHRARATAHPSGARVQMTRDSGSPPGGEWSLRGLARAVMIAAIALGTGAALGYLVAHDRSDTSTTSGAAPRPPPSKPAGPAELALIAPLAKGSNLGGFRVREVQGVNHGALRVVCAKDGSVVRLDIALASDDGPPAPAQAGKYSIFYSLKNASPEDGERLAKDLAAIVNANEEAKTPPGMTPFTPLPEEPVSL